MLKSYKYRLCPTGEQKVFFEKSFGCARYVYNWALDKKIKAYEEDKTSLSAYDLIKELPILKKDGKHEWLSEVNAASLQQSISNMDSAYKNFFKTKKGFPKFKSKHKSKPSVRFIHPSIRIDFENKRIFIPKAKWMKLYLDRTFDGVIKSITVSKSPVGHYYVSVLVDNGLEVPNKYEVTEDNSVGIDLGIKDFAILSNGVRYENKKYYEKEQKKLTCHQRRLARKQRGSNRYVKQRIRVAKIHESIRNKRNDYLHKISTQIIRENQSAFIEDLNVDGMLQNHCLAKSISSVAWSTFVGMLEYKAEWNGVNVIRIGRFEPSSKTCYCGAVNRELKLSDREWVCVECGSINDRDLLAAHNIKKFGLNKFKPPAVSGEENVELSAVVGAMKR